MGKFPPICVPISFIFKLLRIRTKVQGPRHIHRYSAALHRLCHNIQCFRRNAIRHQQSITHTATDGTTTRSAEGGCLGVGKWVEFQTPLVEKKACEFKTHLAWVQCHQSSFACGSLEYASWNLNSKPRATSMSGSNHYMLCGDAPCITSSHPFCHQGA